MEIFVSLITAFSAMGIAVLGYFLTKKRERDSEWRREKLEYYKAFIRSLNGVLESTSTPEGKEAFAIAANDLLLFAPQAVLNALFKYLDTSKESEPSQDHDKLLSDLLREIRADLSVEPKDDPATFGVRLWSPGR